MQTGVAEQPPQLRPLGVGEILDVSLKVYRRNFAAFIGIVAVIVIPLAILTTLISLSLIPDGAVVIDGVLRFPLDAESELDAYNIFVWIAVVVGILASLLAAGVGVRAVADAYLGKKPSIKGSFAYVGRRLHSLTWLSLLVMISVVLGALALLIPGIYLGIAFIAAVPVLVIEGIKGTKAMSRSYQLTQGRWWASFGVFLVGVLLLPFIIGFAVGFLLGLGLAGQDFTDPTTYEVVSSVINVIGSLIGTPIQVVVITVLYFDLRVRKEAFDLQLLAERMEGGLTAPSETLPPAGPASPSA